MQAINILVKITHAKFSHTMEFILLLKASNANINVAYHTSNDRLAIEIGWWSNTSISRVKRLCQVWSWKVVENEANFVLEHTFWKFIRFPSLSVVLGCNLKSIFWFNYQIHISLYLTEVNVLRYRRELAFLTPPCCTSSPMSILTSLTFESISSHWNKKRWEFLLRLNRLWLYRNRTTQWTEGAHKSS